MAEQTYSTWEIKKIIMQDDLRQEAFVEWEDTYYHCEKCLHKLVAAFPDVVDKIDMVNKLVKWKPQWIKKNDINTN